MLIIAHSRAATEMCADGEDDEVVVFVSKVFTVPKTQLSRNGHVFNGGTTIVQPKPRPRNGDSTAEESASQGAVPSGVPGAEDEGERTTDAEDEHDGDEFMGMARVFSGTIRVGQQVHILVR